MTADQILFLAFAAVALGLAVAAVTLRDLVRSAFALVGGLFAVAALYALLEASLFVVAQVAVYIGAIAALIVLVVMLTRRAASGDERAAHRYAPAAALLAGLVFAGLSAGLSQSGVFSRAPGTLPAGDPVVALGSALIDPQRFLVPFEVVSILLLAALIGAVLVAGGAGGGEPTA
jgi:NADH-quinone oxidoreductase subunit J